MPTPLIKRWIHNTCRRWPVKLVLLGYVWLCCGRTIPTTLLMSSETAKIATAKDRSVPFPCMDKACGCRNAEQCFKSCCCSTKAERIAWAKEHAVSEEYIALANAAEEPAQQKPNSCCVKQPTLSCCEAQPVVPSCCSKQQAKTASSECCSKSNSANIQYPPAKVPAAKTPPEISLLAALKCQGISTTWLGVPLSLLVESPEWNLTLVAVETIVIVKTFYTAHSDVPTTPPPNSILA